MAMATESPSFSLSLSLLLLPPLSLTPTLALSLSHTLSLSLSRTHCLSHTLPLSGRTGGGLVEVAAEGVADHGDRHREAPLHAAGEGPGFLVHHVQQVDLVLVYGLAWRAEGLMVKL